MAWIPMISREDAGGELRDVYQQIAGRRGKVANVFTVQSLHPKSMLAHLDLYISLMFDREVLDRERCELIAVAVSATNKCPYCVRHHSDALNHYWRDHNRTALYALDVANYPLDPTDRAMVDYAIKLTRDPSSMKREDIEALREAGFDDRQVLLINQVSSYFSYVNRMVQGLGVEFDDDMEGFKY